MAICLFVYLKGLYSIEGVSMLGHFQCITLLSIVIIETKASRDQCTHNSSDPNLEGDVLVKVTQSTNIIIPNRSLTNEG